jgi:hypothetical protein
VPWKIANGTENLVLQGLKFQQMGICRKFGEPVMTDLLPAISVESELLTGPQSLDLPLQPGVGGFAEFGPP